LRTSAPGSIDIAVCCSPSRIVRASLNRGVLLQADAGGDVLSIRGLLVSEVISSSGRIAGIFPGLAILHRAGAGATGRQSPGRASIFRWTEAVNRPVQEGSAGRAASGVRPLDPAAVPLAWRPGKAAITARARTACSRRPTPTAERSIGMTTTIDTAPEGALAGNMPRPDAPSTFEHTGQPMERAMIAVALLTVHPDNVRRDISLNQEFLDSIAEQGVLTPLRITPDGSGGYRVIEGHRRLAAAEKLGLTEVPYDLAAEREHDEAGQFLDMYTVNHHRKGFTVLEEADALFGASQHGASKTRIRKATGLGKDQLSAALSAAGMRGVARATAEGLGDAITLDQLALLSEFGDDEEAVGRLTTAFCEGTSGQHVAERIRQERAEAAEHEQLVAQFLADGYTVTEELPPNGCMLHSLAHASSRRSPRPPGGQGTLPGDEQHGILARAEVGSRSRFLPSYRLSLATEILVHATEIQLQAAGHDKVRYFL
jgi:ParB/RepB/Spo0J family partition protein